MTSETTKNPDGKNNGKPTKGSLSLNHNPNIETVHAWSAHVMQDMLYSKKKVPITHDMVDLVAQSEILYSPLWNLAAEINMGSFIRVKSSIPVNQHGTGELLKQDMTGLLSACIQMYALQDARKNALVVIPVRASTLNDPCIADFYLSVIQCIHADIRKNFVFEVKSIPKNQDITKLQKRLADMTPLIRGVMFDTGMLNYFDYTKSFPKLHACGFDISEGNLTEDEALKKIAKYVAAYKKFNTKIYIKGVSSQKILGVCMKEKFIYASGTFIAAPEKICWPVQKILIKK